MSEGPSLPHVKRHLIEHDINAVAEQINKQPEQQFVDHKRVHTGTHVRTHGIFKATFTVLDNLPPHLQNIEFTSTPAIELADARTAQPHGFGPSKGTLQGCEPSPRIHTQYSQTAYRFSDYVFIYCVVPNTETQKKLYDEYLKPDQHESNIPHEWP
ncbi:hypothetical protein CLAFUW4_14000 [Fulvia fulva]|uniref:Uncharacterized protein n=1 Tax=Passalora fulva TaxID=5499 RepID=A0A9Q8PKJ3_PASFU|nr:uncharacterized protein CLAFUR5_13839 [Fulvia fulva]KAK4610576.1 hypothetical protein CLAFUR4_14003 [Fulvia fulva]KAK4611118.1 hypothetical protein CLAFUR0_14007 [Fulvia fulva]UJO24136.1 hypothetical protein CLAFUR5_13839 [Fulvia fulva]WPV22103.1 hypothetical protein CLAFUW4_14000 [Fulvia fulva]WPV36946.1 hypothetical protein CLAFUW7_14009 [Fulvia fulva]